MNPPMTQMIYINKSLVRVLVCMAFMSGLLFGFAMANAKIRGSIAAFYQGPGPNPNNSGGGQ